MSSERYAPRPQRSPIENYMARSQSCNTPRRVSPYPRADHSRWAAAVCVCPLCCHLLLLAVAEFRRVSGNTSSHLPSAQLSYSHYVFDLLQRSRRNGAYLVCPLLEHVLQCGQVVHQFAMTRLDGRQGCDQAFGERRLEITIALALELRFDL